jgi:hypothetical protein
MRGWMTSWHEGSVSTMLTESDLSIPLRLRHFKALARRNGACKPKSAPCAGLFVWTAGGTGSSFRLSASSKPRTRHATESDFVSSNRASTAAISIHAQDHGAHAVVVLLAIVRGEQSQRSAMRLEGTWLRQWRRCCGSPGLSPPFLPTLPIPKQRNRVVHLAVLFARKPGL